MANKAISSLAVGSSVYLNVGGTRTEFLVVHQGLPSSLYDSSCDGTWLLMKDCYESRAWHSSNSNSYETSTINTYLNGPFLNLFDSAVQGIIKQVKVPYRKGGGSGGTDQSGANGLSAKIFLLSGYEVGWTTSDDAFPVDGAKLDYFAASISGNSKRIANYEGSAAYWWLRSPYTSADNSVVVVSDTGRYYNNVASLLHGIRPCIILPSTTLVDDSGNVVTVDLTAHKTLINGTAYTVQGGKCMVDGTIYSILKGRTLIDGTAWDIAFPTPLAMPVKGDLITMNLDGTDRVYRILALDGDVAKVFALSDLTSGAFDTNGYRYYFGAALDTYLNTTWYNQLTTNARSAIQSVSITQDSWTWGASGNYNGTYGESIPGANSYGLSKGAFSGGTNSRYVYALSVQDIVDYLSDTSLRIDASGELRNVNLWNMLWGKSSKSSTNIWLRDFDSTNQYAAFMVYGSNGLISTSGATGQYVYRPAFQIDLSKIDFTIGGA